MTEDEIISTRAIGGARFCPRLGETLLESKKPIPWSESSVLEQSGLVEFHKELTRLVSRCESLNIGKLQHLLKTAKDCILQAHADASCDGLRTAIDRIVAQVLVLGRALTQEHQIDPGQLLTQFYGGVPEFDKTLDSMGIRAHVDILARGARTCRVWRIVPEDGLSFDTNANLKNALAYETAAAAMVAEAAVGLPCDGKLLLGEKSRVIVISAEIRNEILRLAQRVREHAVPNIEPQRCQSCMMHKEFCTPCADISPTEITGDAEVEAEPAAETCTEVGSMEPKNDAAKVEMEPVGKIVQTVSRQLEIKAGRKRLYGFFFEEKAKFHQPGEVICALSTEDKGGRLLCRIIEMKSSTQFASIPGKRTEGFVCDTVFEPIGLNDGGHLRDVPNDDFHDYTLYPPSIDDIRTLYDLPRSGIGLGSIDCESSSATTPYLYDPTQGYKSIFVCGGQGTGKTNFLKYMIQEYSTSTHVAPAIVILDVEGQFTKMKLARPERPVGGCGQAGNPTLSVLKVSSPEVEGDVALSFKEIGEKNICCFVPDLPTRTTEMLENIVSGVCARLAAKGEEMLVQKVLREIDVEARQDGRLHFSQRDAIQRAVVSPTFRLFDQPGIPPLLRELLMVPGKVTVIDASDLSEDEQRVTAIYLLAVLFEAKMKGLTSETDKTPLLLVIDEAHRLFPKNRGLKRDYVTRVANFVREVTHRGRKRNYGVVLATQSPSDISDDIVSLCETKLFFRVAGHQTWLREHVGSKETVSAIGNLRNFRAYVTVKGKTNEPIALRFPNVSD